MLLIESNVRKEAGNKQKEREQKYREELHSKVYGDVPKIRPITGAVGIAIEPKFAIAIAFAAPIKLGLRA
jgi:hypothetical protein